MHGSLDELYRRHGPALLRRARAILANDAAARDAVQETFVCALRAGSGFRNEASPTTWLYRITTNLCLNQLRDGARRSALLDERGPVAEAAPADQEDRVTLTQVLSRVPEELREIAVYYYVDRMSQDEIASMLSVARRTVGNRLEEFKRLAQAAGEGAP